MINIKADKELRKYDKELREKYLDGYYLGYDVSTEDSVILSILSEISRSYAIYESYDVWDKIKNDNKLLDYAITCLCIESANFDQDYIRGKNIGYFILDRYKDVNKESYLQLINEVFSNPFIASIRLRGRELKKYECFREETYLSLALSNHSLTLTNKQKKFAEDMVLNYEKYFEYGDFSVKYHILSNPNWTIEEKKKLVYDFFKDEDLYNQQLKRWENYVSPFWKGYHYLDCANYKGFMFANCDYDYLSNQYEEVLEDVRKILLVESILNGTRILLDKEKHKSWMLSLADTSHVLLFASFSNKLNDEELRKLGLDFAVEYKNKIFEEIKFCEMMEKNIRREKIDLATYENIAWFISEDKDVKKVLWSYLKEETSILEMAIKECHKSILEYKYQNFNMFTNMPDGMNKIMAPYIGGLILENYQDVDKNVYLDFINLIFSNEDIARNKLWLGSDSNFLYSSYLLIALRNENLELTNDQKYFILNEVNNHKEIHNDICVYNILKSKSFNVEEKQDLVSKYFDTNKEYNKFLNLIARISNNDLSEISSIRRENKVPVKIKKY